MKIDSVDIELIIHKIVDLAPVFDVWLYVNTLEFNLSNFLFLKKITHERAYIWVKYVFLVLIDIVHLPSSIFFQFFFLYFHLSHTLSSFLLSISTISAKNSQICHKTLKHPWYLQTRVLILVVERIETKNIKISSTIDCYISMAHSISYFLKHGSLIRQLEYM